MFNSCAKCGQKVDAKTGLCTQCDQAILMKKKKSKKISIIAIAILCCICIIVGTFGAIRFFNKDNVSYTYGTYNSFMEGFTDVLVTDEKSAIEAVDSVSAALGIENATEELKVDNVQSVKDDHFYRIQQYYKDIPVYGRSIVISADKNGNALALTSNYKQISKDINLSPQVSQNDISESISKYLKISNVSIQDISADNLVIYNFEEKDVLAYSITINGLDTIIVDANTADVIHYVESFSDLTFEVKSKDGSVSSVGWQNDDGSYHLYNDEYKIEVFDLKGIDSSILEQGSVHENFKYYGIDRLYSKNNGFDKNAIILLNDVINISNYYKKLGLGGFDQIYAGINDGYDKGENARGGGEFDGIYYAIMLFGTEFNFEDKDSIMHEYTHSVTRLKVGWIKNHIENKALNEAYSDIFGSLYDNDRNPDWKIFLVNEMIRDLTNPSKTGQYDHMADINGARKYNKYTLSTIVSHSAYLMWNGIDGSENRKINAATLSEMWYRSMLLLQSDANFSQCRNAVELAARMMLKNNQETEEQNKLTEEQYKTVITAFEMVGIENATFTYTETVKNQFDLSVLSSKETENVNFNLEIIKMPTFKAGPGVVNNETPKLVVEKTAITGRQSLDLQDGTYVLRLSDIADERNISQTINVKIIVDGDNVNAKDEVVINTDFTDVIVAAIDGKTDIPQWQDFLTEYYWEYNGHADGYYKFLKDGTVKEYQWDWEKGFREENLEENKYCDLKYSVIGDTLRLYRDGWSCDLKWVTSKDQYKDITDWCGAERYLDQNIGVFFQVGWTFNEDYPYDDAQYLVKRELEEAPEVNISFEEAKEIARKHFGISEDGYTGEMMAAAAGEPESAIEVDGIIYYYFRFSVRIDEGRYAHWTTWDQTYVNSKTGECVSNPRT